MQTFTRFANDVLSVKVAGEAEALGVTSEHPFFVKVYGARSSLSSDSDANGEWKVAGELNIGDEIRTASGDWARVESIESRADEQVYNFEVSINHNYFVGGQGLLAHNTCNRNKPRIESGNSKEGWQHINERHVTGSQPGGDLFPPGTTQSQLQKAAEKLVNKGTRNTDPSKQIQTFDKRMKVNGQRDRVKVVVDSHDNNRVITIFPVRQQ